MQYETSFLCISEKLPCDTDLLPNNSPHSYLTVPYRTSTVPNRTRTVIAGKRYDLIRFDTIWNDGGTVRYLRGGLLKIDLY